MRRRQVLKATAGLAAVAALARPRPVTAVTGYDAGDRGGRLEAVLKRVSTNAFCRSVILNTLDNVVQDDYRLDRLVIIPAGMGA